MLARRLLMLLLLAPGGCAGEPKSRPGDYQFLCRVTVYLEEEFRTFLSGHGIQAVSAGGGMGMMDMCVVGRSDAFRARQILESDYGARRFAVIWTAEHQYHPGEPGWQSTWDPPAKPRVATVLFQATPSQRVLNVLEDAGLNPEIDFGTTEDCVRVPRSQVRQALDLLGRVRIEGVTVRVPVGFDEK